jgi:hypothetical protein
MWVNSPDQVVPPDPVEPEFRGGVSVPLVRVRRSSRGSRIALHIRLPPVLGISHSVGTCTWGHLYLAEILDLKHLSHLTDSVLEDYEVYADEE